MIHPGQILKLRVRGTNRDLFQETSSEEVCVVMQGVIARFDGSEIKVCVIFFLLHLRVLCWILVFSQNPFFILSFSWS